jgi:DNA-binding CsgD family transcriptional regulator
MVRSYLVDTREHVQQQLSELALRAPSLLAYRQAALECIATALRFDAALFHELSPRTDLSSAAWKALDLAALEAGRGSWDENAVLLGRLRELALEQGGVASDREAFPPGSRARKNWDARVAKPLRVRSTLAAHLVVRDRIISAVLLFRRTAGPFGKAEQATLRELVPILSLGDGLQQALAGAPLTGPATQLRCVDQRLTARQREIVEQVALGYTNADIGAVLELSANTVRNLLTEVRRRLGAANRAEVVRLAVLR